MSRARTTMTLPIVGDVETLAPPFARAGVGGRSKPLEREKERTRLGTNRHPNAATCVVPVDEQYVREGQSEHAARRHARPMRSAHGAVEREGTTTRGRTSP